MKTPVVLLACVLALLAAPAPAPAGSPTLDASMAEAYEQLANTLIAARAAETALAQVIVVHHRDLAMAALDAGDFRAAATHVGHVANEGDKAVQAVRQRLVQAGHHHHHHHHADGESTDDYVFVDADEKKGLLDFAGRVAKAGEGDAAALKQELAGLVDAALAPEE